MFISNIQAPAPLQQPSHLHVVTLGTRYLLTDGYHRGYALLSRGIQFAPGFFKAVTSYSELGMPPGLLPEKLLDADRPPLLTDLLIDGVSVDLF